MSEQNTSSTTAAEQPSCVGVPAPNLTPLPTFDWEAFRTEGHKVVDFIADYHRQLRDREIPVHPTIATGAGFLPKAMGLPDGAPLPMTPQPFDNTLDQIKKGVVPGMLHWQHPDFFGYFPAQLGPAAMLGEMMGTAMNTPGFSWQSAPSASEMERLVMRWVGEMFNLPKDLSFEGTGGAVMQPSATEAAIVAILAAKNKKMLKGASVEERMDIASRLVVYVSDQAHFCIEKAAKVLSIPHFRKIQSVRTNDFFVGNYKMDVEALRGAVEADKSAGLIPCFISCNFGATGICAIDEIQLINDTVAKPNDVWINIDAAYAGVVAVLPEFRHMTSVFGVADSLFINASKWMGTMFNATLFFFRERAPVVMSLNASGAYLDNDFTASGAVVDYKDYQLGLGRPFRSLKLYTTLQSIGVEGLSSLVRRHVALAKYLFDSLHYVNTTAHGGSLLDFPVEPLFGLVCFTFKNKTESEALAILKRLNATNKLFAVHTLLNNEVIIRISLAYPDLTVTDMDRLVEVIIEGVASN